MATAINKILNQALALNPVERASIAEQLLESLDKPDIEMDKIWAKEAETRIEQYNNGDIPTISASNVFAKYKK